MFGWSLDGNEMYSGVAFYWCIHIVTQGFPLCHVTFAFFVIKGSGFRVDVDYSSTDTTALVQTETECGGIAPSF